MNIVADVSLLQAVTLFSVGFLGALIGGITSLIGGSKAKKAAAKAATDAKALQAKQEKLERDLQDKRDAAAGKKQDWIMKLAMIGGGVLIFIVVIFMFKKKR